MSAGDTMQGRRLRDDDPLEHLSPGDYRLDQARRGLWICLPNGAATRLDVADGVSSPTSDRVWGFTEHDDGTITVTPSIYLRWPADQEWHGFLERGVWREV